MYYLFVSHKQKISSINLSHPSCCLVLCLKISFSIFAIKILAKAILVSMACSVCLEIDFSINVCVKASDIHED